LVSIIINNLADIEKLINEKQTNKKNKKTKQSTQKIRKSKKDRQHNDQKKKNQTIKGKKRSTRQYT